MRKLLISALTILCLFLTACGGGEQQLYERTCEDLTSASSLALTAVVTADFGETVEQYTLDYDYDGESWTVAVIEPAWAAGITARITQGGSTLEYDGVILSTGDLLGDGVKPIAAVPLLVEMLCTGYVDRVWSEGEETVGHVQYTDSLGANLWLDAGGVPVAAELIENNIVKAACSFSNVEIRTDTYEYENEANLGGN